MRAILPNRPYPVFPSRIPFGQLCRRTRGRSANPIEALTSDSGNRSGTNTLQDPNTGKPKVSPSRATVTPVLCGRFVRVDSTWGYQGQPQEGSLLVGFDPQSGEISGHWIDTWHMDRKDMACLGSARLILKARSRSRR